MRNTGPLKLNIRDDRLREDLENAILDQMGEAMAGASQRNDDLREMDDQWQMLSGQNSTEPWRDACDLNDTTTFDQGLTILAMISQAVQRDPKVLTEAARKEDERSAQTLEYFLATKLYEAGYNKQLNYINYNAGRWPYSILYVGWREDVEDYRYTGYKHPETGEIVEEEFTEEEGVEYEEVPQRRPGNVTYSGLDLRAVDSPDFYMYPPEAIRINSEGSSEGADACGEIVRVTKHGLLDGIESLGLDREKVYELLESGPSGFQEEGANDYRETMNDRDGVDSIGENYYELMVWYTRMPILYEGGKMRTPDYLLKDTFLCIGCPSRRMMLRMDYSPRRNIKPYVNHCLFEVPNEFQGWCIPKMLDGLQAEANANLQMGINVMNFELMPMLKAPETQRKYLENQQASPGKIFYYMGNDANAIQPLYFPNTLRGNQETSALISNKSEKLVSAGGFGSYQSKQRKNVETQAVQQAAFTKFDFYLSNFQRGIEETCRHCVALLAEHMDEDGEDFLDPFDNAQHVTPQMLKSRYIFRPVANSTNTDPNTRVTIAREVTEAVDEYLALMMNPQTPPKVLKLRWHATREMLVALGKHNPEAYIGEEPEDVPQQAPPPPPMNYTPMNMGGGNAVGNGNGAGVAPMGLPTG